MIKGVCMKGEHNEKERKKLDALKKQVKWKNDERSEEDKENFCLASNESASEEMVHKV